MTKACSRPGRSGALPAAVLFATASTPVPATNGSNALALSSEAFGIGGADIACLQNTAAMAVNPASPAFIDKARMDLGPGITGSGSIRHKDGFGRGLHHRNTPIPFSGFGYLHRLSADTVAGVALVGRGGVGVEPAFTATDRLDPAAEMNRINGSDALDRPRLTATGPDNPVAPATIAVAVIQEWDDQVVSSAGAVHAACDRQALRAGSNHAKKPTPERNLLPLQPLIGERHAMPGLGHDLPGNRQVDAVYVRRLPNAVTCPNANAPFGPAAENNSACSA